ncbi:hypothetical protein CsSME_00044464 [Camellia sinensis var. sinensis]
MDYLNLNEFQKKLSTHFRPWQRSFQFWLRATDIYTDVRKQEAMWERQHELAVDELIHMCSDLGGIFQGCLSSLRYVIKLLQPRLMPSKLYLKMSWVNVLTNCLKDLMLILLVLLQLHRYIEQD